MDGMSLLRRAKDAGLKVQADGDKLIVRGPRRLEAAALELLRHKPVVMAALASEVGDKSSPADWQSLYHDIVAARTGRQYSVAEARAFAWGALLTRWHLRYGERVPAVLCAGCRNTISDGDALDLADGRRVHLADNFACVLRYGERWRGAAERALAEFGLLRPEGVDS
jgi:hypothetical protein